MTSTELEVSPTVATGDSASRRGDLPAHGRDRPLTEKDSPGELPKRSWWAIVKRTVKEFQDDELSDRAAALTY